MHDFLNVKEHKNSQNNAENLNNFIFINSTVKYLWLTSVLEKCIISLKKNLFSYHFFFQI